MDRKRVDSPLRYYPIYTFQIDKDRWDAWCLIDEFEKYSVSASTGFYACILMSDLLISVCNQYLSKNMILPFGYDNIHLLLSARNNECLYWLSISLDDSNTKNVNSLQICKAQACTSHCIVSPQINLWTRIGEIERRRSSKFLFDDGFYLPVLTTIKYDILHEIMTDLIQKHHPKYVFGTRISDSYYIQEFIGFGARETLDLLRDEIGKYSLEEILKWLFPQVEIVTYLREHQLNIQMGQSYNSDNKELLEHYFGQNIFILAEIQLAQIQLMDVSVSESPSGSEKLTQNAFEILLALASLCSNFWWSKSHLNAGLCLNNVEIYRYGFDTNEMDEHVTEFGDAKAKEALEITNAEYKKYNIESTRLTELNEDPKERAFSEEFGLTYKQLHQFRDGLSVFCSHNNTAYCRFSERKFRDFMISSFKWSEEMCSSGLNIFCMNPRGKWDEVPDGYKWDDIDLQQPFGRLSFRRLAMVRIPLTNGDSVIYYGKRSFQSKFEALIRAIMNDKYPTQSSQMRSWIKRWREASASAFANNAAGIIHEQLSLRTELEVKVHDMFELDDDIGDIDIAVVDLEENVFYSIECKNMTHAYTSKQFLGQNNNFGATESLNQSKTYVKKHLRRDEYLKRYRRKLQERYGFTAEPEIVSLFLTSHLIESQSTPNLPIPIISYHELIEDGKGTLERCRAFYQNRDQTNIERT